MSSRAGQLLVASKRLLDPNFVRTVVLIVQHEPGGVIGLILNRPLELTVAEACDPAAEEASAVQDSVHQGGPCPGPLMVLHSDEVIGGEQVVPGVRFTAERDAIQALMRDHEGPIRYFAGYSGWAVQQLEDEIAEGAWLLTPANVEQVFSDAGGALWSRLTTVLTVGKYVDLDQMPDDPTVN
jgi:putative transcriptional regulator